MVAPCGSAIVCLHADYAWFALGRHRRALLVTWFRMLNAYRQPTTGKVISRRSLKDNTLIYPNCHVLTKLIVYIPVNGHVICGLFCARNTAPSCAVRSTNAQ